MDNALYSAVNTGVGDALSAVAPVAAVILAAIVGWRLFKRFVS